MSSSKISKQQALDVIEVLRPRVSAIGITGKLAQTGEGKVLNLVVFLRNNRHTPEDVPPFVKFSEILDAKVKDLYRCKCPSWDDSGMSECEFCAGWDYYFDSEEEMNRYYERQHADLVLPALLSALQFDRAERGWWKLATRSVSNIRAIVLPDTWQPNDGYGYTDHDSEVESLYPSSFNISRMVRGVYGVYTLPYNGELSWRQVNWEQKPCFNGWVGGPWF